MCLLFNIHYHCTYGDSIFICGNIEELGNWDFKKAYRLEWTSFDNWKGKIVLSENKYESIQYKYIVKNTNGDCFPKNVIWEENNRYLVLDKESLIELYEVWNHQDLTKVTINPQISLKKVFLCLENEVDFIKGELNYDALWNLLYDEAKKFTLNTYVNEHHPLQTNALKINSYLRHGCPAARSFLKAARKIGLDPSKPLDIFNAGKFGWHGTRSDQNILSILYNNLDIQRRFGQSYGPGAYCTVDAQSGYWGNTLTLLLFFILEKNNPYFTLNNHIRINNPSKTEVYMVPILIATFSNRNVPIDLERNKNCNFCWEWLDSLEWIPYGQGEYNYLIIQNKMEELYQKFNHDKNRQEFILNFFDTKNDLQEKYKIDFQCMKQRNMKTNFTRDIRRINK